MNPAPPKPRSVGFPAVARADARVLILGTLPGAESLRRRQYYAWKHNAFWPIMGALVGAHPDLPYGTRLQRLVEHGIALWDVCHAAERDGSLDADIRAPVANDFPSFFAAHPHIAQVCFNGQPAARLYARHVKHGLDVPAMSYATLPSTSPAYAAMPFADKLARWQAALATYIG